MLIKRLDELKEIIANDGCRLREVLHPERDPTDLPYSLAYAWVEPGKSTLPHWLEGRSEVYSILRGRGRMHIGDEVADVGPGDTFVVPPGVVQWIETLGSDELFFSVTVSPPWTAESDVRATPE